MASDMANKVKPVLPFILAALFAGAVLSAAWGRDDELIPKPVDEIPADILLVTSAIVLQLRDRPPPEDATPVVFEHGSAENLKERYFTYEGFRLVRTMLGRFERLPENPKKASLGGMFDFRDDFGRQTMVAFEADYEIGEAAIHVTRARSAPYFRSRPQVNVFVVPAEAVSKEAVANFMNNAQLLVFAADNAVPLDRPDEIPSGPRNYYVFAFFMDRLAPDDVVELEVGNDPEGMSGEDSDALILNHAGWRVAIVQAEFAIDEEIFFKAVYTPGSHAPVEERRPTPVGVFTTKPPPSRPSLPDPEAAGTP